METFIGHELELLQLERICGSEEVKARMVYGKSAGTITSTT